MAPLCHALVVFSKCCTIRFMWWSCIAPLHFNLLCLAVVPFIIVITCIYNTFDAGIMMIHFLYFSLHNMSPFLLLKVKTFKIIMPFNIFFIISIFLLQINTNLKKNFSLCLIFQDVIRNNKKELILTRTEIVHIME